MRLKDRKQLDARLQTASALNAAKTGAIIDDVRLFIDAQLAASDAKVKLAETALQNAVAGLVAAQTEIATLKAKVTALEAKVK
jgi:hypothetical protein